jgi:hypothetical protein
MQVPFGTFVYFQLQICDTHAKRVGRLTELVINSSPACPFKVSGAFAFWHSENAINSNSINYSSCAVLKHRWLAVNLKICSEPGITLCDATEWEPRLTRKAPDKAYPKHLPAVPGPGSTCQPPSKRRSLDNTQATTGSRPQDNLPSYLYAFSGRGQSLNSIASIGRYCVRLLFHWPLPCSRQAFMVSANGLCVFCGFLYADGCNDYFRL